MRYRYAEDMVKNMDAAVKRMAKDRDTRAARGEMW